MKGKHSQFRVLINHISDLSMSDEQAGNQVEPSITPDLCSDSSSCTLSSSSNGSSPPPPLMSMSPNQQILLRQETFRPNPVFLCKLVEMGISPDMARRALLSINNCSVEMALQWLLEYANYGVVEQGGNQMIEEEEEEDSDMEETMMLMLLINESLDMSPGQLGSASARATARIMKQAKDILGREVVTMWDQCGRRTEVREVEDTKEMESLVNLVQSDQGFSFLVEFDDSWVIGGEERKVMALFGNTEEMEALFGYSDESFC